MKVKTVVTSIGMGILGAGIFWAVLDTLSTASLSQIAVLSSISAVLFSLVSWEAQRR